MRHATLHDGFDPVTGLDWAELCPPEYERWCYGGGKGRAPRAPDPAETARAQAAANREATLAGLETGMVNQRTPFGDLTFSEIGTTDRGNPRFEAVQTLPEDQMRQIELLNQAGIRFGETANRQLGAASEGLAQPIDFASLGPAPTFDEGTRVDAANQIMARLQPQINQDRAALETQLASQGIQRGTEAFRNAMRPFNQQLTDTRLAADIQGGAEAARQFSLGQTARNAALNELVQQRQIPLNETLALLSGTQVRGPQFITPPSANFDAPDIMGATFAANQIEQQRAAQQAASQQALMGGLFGLGGSLISGAGLAGGFPALFGMSDRRLKRDIARIGALANGLPVYRYNYVWGGESAGVMADEVRAVMPDAVVRVGEYDAVDYGKVLQWA